MVEINGSTDPFVKYREKCKQAVFAQLRLHPQGLNTNRLVEILLSRGFERTVIGAVLLDHMDRNIVSSNENFELILTVPELVTKQDLTDEIKALKIDKNNLLELLKSKTDELDNRIKQQETTN